MKGINKNLQAISIPEETDLNQLEGQPGYEYTGEYLLRMGVKELPTLLGNILPKVGLATLAGGSDTGKSCILRELAIQCAVGKTEYLGFPLWQNHRSAIMVCTEDDYNATAYILGKQAAGIDPSELKGLRFVFDSETIIEELDGNLSNQPADLVIIDCYGDVAQSDMMDPQKTRAYLNRFATLAKNHECLILFLHHTGKRTEDLKPSKNNLLSSQSFEAKMRLVMELRLDSLDPEIRHLCIVKGNYLPAEFKQDSYVLRFDPETLTFTNTGIRVPFDKLTKGSNDQGKAKWEEAMSLKKQGMTYSQIAEKLGYATKGAVSKLLSKGEQNGWTLQ